MDDLEDMNPIESGIVSLGQLFPSEIESNGAILTGLQIRRLHIATKRATPSGAVHLPLAAKTRRPSHGRLTRHWPQRRSSAMAIMVLAIAMIILVILNSWVQVWSSFLQTKPGDNTTKQPKKTKRGTKS